MAWRLAKSLEVLRVQANILAPKRSKVSDGAIGDAAHASRSSDHNPWVKDGATGVVTGLDLTHDPANGFDCAKVTETLRVSRDLRIKYVIYNKRIFSYLQQGKTPAWQWRPYYGSNPHQKHFHTSVRPDKVLYDNTDPWTISGTIIPSHVQPPVAKPVPPAPALELKKGSKGDAVRILQTALGIGVDGDFGPKTDAAVRQYQTLNGLPVDGVVGPEMQDKLRQQAKVINTNRAQRAMEIFTKELGYSKIQAAAIVGNMQQESYRDLQTTAVGDKGTAFGLFQWRKSRHEDLKDFAASRKATWDDFETQVNFADHELKTTEKYAGKRLRDATTIEEATEAVIAMLRPAGFTKEAPRNGHGWANRLKNAKALLL